jgi:hypothetical protein
MNLSARDVLVGGALVALVLPWAITTLLWLGTPLFVPSNIYQFAVFSLVFSRALLYLGTPTLRKLSWGASIILFSGDILIFPAATLLSVITGSQSLVVFAVSYTASWFSASLLVYPPVAAYAIIGSLRERGRLTYVLPAAACCFTFSTLVLVAIESSAGSPGLNGLLGLALAEARRPVPPPGWTLGVITGCGAILFVSLAAYAVTGRSDFGERLAPQLSLGIAGALGLYAWILALPKLGPLLVLGVPTLVLVSVIWVATRGS